MTNSSRTRFRDPTEKLVEQLDNLAGQVKTCVDLVDRIQELTNQINALTDRRLEAHSELNRLRNQMKEYESSHRTAPQSLGADVYSLTEKIDFYSNEIELLSNEIEQLHRPFRQTERNVQSFVRALRDLLNYLPVGVPELVLVREEIERF
jgi:chromosome segregation ATPase